MSAGSVERGEIYPINPSSVLAVLALAPQPDEEVLDLAAAPGGKTLLMAAAMDNRGRIAAVEPVKSRFHRMRANLARCGVRNVDFYLSDGRGVGRKVGERFDAVLLDVPCSSEARFRLDDPASYAHWKLRKIKEVARKQKSLLRSAFTALKPGGRLIYCTCALAPEENEIPLDYLVRREPAAKLESVSVVCPQFIPGLTRWRAKVLHSDLQRAVRVLPDDLWDGLFICKIVKRDQAGS
ncbi:MAG: RsmB/NOP family class I SAM-dependent RNA methyltransferase [Pseudomonadales bacterium]